MGVLKTAAMATPKLRARGKQATRYPVHSESNNNRPSVEIMKCIGFQKFRYSGENRPGKKYQDKDFLQLALRNMSGKTVKIQIICFDADKPGEIHPNGLVGRDCEDGIYSKNYPISKATQIIRIPYLRTERMKTKKDDRKAMKDVLKKRAEKLPSPYKDQCLKQLDSEGSRADTTRVCFGVIVTIDDSNTEPLCVVSNVVQNASEKTTLRIQKLSISSVSALDGGYIDIFTSEDGPPITEGKCSVSVYVKEMDWTSDATKPSKDEIMYKRVVSYRVPPFKPNPGIETPFEATLTLSCIQSGQSCTFQFQYIPGSDIPYKVATINKPIRKRPYSIEAAQDDLQNMTDSDIIKLRVKDKVQGRQVPGEYQRNLL